MKRTPLLRKSPLRRVSKKRALASRTYAQKRKAFLIEFPLCEVCPKIQPFFGSPGTGYNWSCDVHHTKGRLGEGYLDEKTWLPVCRSCHDQIHRNPRWARDMGLLA